MERLKELRMTLIILLVGVFFLSGCFFSSKKEITFKTNGGSVVKNVTVKKGNKIEEPEKPTKAGYEFVGWYLDGEEYDFDKEVSDDITLIAKWVKVDDVDTGLDLETTEPVTEPTTEDTTKASIVNRTTLKKIKATKKKTTTVKTTTAPANVEKSTTTTTTTKKPEPVIPIPPIPDLPIDPVDPKQEFMMNISSLDVLDDTGASIGKKEITIDFKSQTPNVESSITEEELQELLKSNHEDWLIHNEHAVIYDKSCVGDKIGFLSDTEVTSLTIVVDEKHYVISYNETTSKWTIKYPTVRVIDGLSTYYYENFKQAFLNLHANATVSLLSDVFLTESITITQPITIDGGEHTLKAEMTPFVIEVTDALEEMITIKNMKIEVDTLATLTNKVEIKQFVLENISGTYKTALVENKGNTLVVETNNTATKEEIVEEGKEETPENKEEDKPSKEITTVKSEEE